MRRLLKVAVPALLAFAGAALAQDRPVEKDWTVLVFLNGFNNLDPFGPKDINEMEKVGSTNKVNVVVQWASYSTKKVKRLLVQRDNDPTKVTSPILSDLGRVDMGDYREVIEFVKWAKQNYPAKHYMLDIWNHGSGWHRAMATARGLIRPTDISFDDLSGNAITTKQMGIMLGEVKSILGHNLDLYGSDACLMGMVEIASEVADSVDVYAGSQELEPGDGWDYAGFLTGLTANSGGTAADAAKVLADSYAASYNNGSQGTRDITFSAYNLAKTDALIASIRDLGIGIQGMSAAERVQIKNIVGSTQEFYTSDYKDLGDFLGQIESRVGINDAVLSKAAAVKSVMGEYLITNRVSESYARAKGVSIWMPDSIGSYNAYAQKYKELKFDQTSHWADALVGILNAN